MTNNDEFEPEVTSRHTPIWLGDLPELVDELVEHVTIYDDRRPTMAVRPGLWAVCHTPKGGIPHVQLYPDSESAYFSALSIAASRDPDLRIAVDRNSYVRQEVRQEVLDILQAFGRANPGESLDVSQAWFDDGAFVAAWEGLQDEFDDQAGDRYRTSRATLHDPDFPDAHTRDVWRRLSLITPFDPGTVTRIAPAIELTRDGAPVSDAELNRQVDDAMQLEALTIFNPVGTARTWCVFGLRLILRTAVDDWPKAQQLIESLPAHRAGLNAFGVLGLAAATLDSWAGPREPLIADDDRHFVIEYLRSNDRVVLLDAGQLADALDEGHVLDALPALCLAYGTGEDCLLFIASLLRLILERERRREPTRMSKLLRAIR